MFGESLKIRERNSATQYHRSEDLAFGRQAGRYEIRHGHRHVKSGAKIGYAIENRERDARNS
jgi:hypothetical protein